MFSPLLSVGGRLIPAWAGKTLLISFFEVRGAAHPRVGGENSAHLIKGCEITGSSPRGRGKPVSIIDQRVGERLIPAWAGKTATSGHWLSVL